MAENVVVHSVDKFTASQTIHLQGVDQLINSKQEDNYPEFQSINDPNGVNLYLELCFGGKEENWLSVYLFQTSEKIQDVFVYKAKFSLTDCNKRHLQSREFTNTLLTGELGNGFSEFFSLKDKVVNTSSKDDYILTCVVTYALNVTNIGSPKFPELSMPATSKEKRLSNDMLTLFQYGNDADVTFNVGGEKLKAHKVILTARSEYFNKMFEADMKEAKSNEVEVPDAEVSVFQEFLQYLYTDDVPENMGFTPSSSLLLLADRYDDEHLKHLCEVSLYNSLVVDNVVETVIVADMHNAATLKQACFDFIKSNFDEVVASEKWIKMKEHPLLLMALLIVFQGKH